MDGSRVSSRKMKGRPALIRAVAPLVCAIIFAFRERLFVKQSHNTPMDAQGERHSSYSFMTLALYGWLASRPCRTLPPGKIPRYPLDMRLGGPQSWSGQKLEEKSFFLCWRSNLDRPVIQSSKLSINLIKTLRL
jgi:hypothetical protein